jgi:hypothetical protein
MIAFAGLLATLLPALAYGSAGPGTADDDSPPRFLEEAARQYLGGDESQAAVLKSAGAGAVRAVRAQRERSPARARELLYSLKQIAAAPVARPLLAELEARRTLEVADDGFRDVYKKLRGLVKVLYDPLIPEHLLLTDLTVKAEQEPVWLILDKVCEPLGLDYSVYGDHVLVSTPEKLWPVRPPARTTALTAAEEKSVRPLVTHLGSDRAAEREEAYRRLESFGKAAVPFLKEGAAVSDPEVSTRCARLLHDALAEVPVPLFAEACGQHPSLKASANSALREVLQQTKVTTSIRDLDLSKMAFLLSPRSKLKLEVGASMNRKGTVDFVEEDLFTVFKLLTQSCGCDVALQGSVVVLDERDKVRALEER